MLVKIAWRNIWRNRTRSLVVIGSIIVGVWAILAGTGFMNGFMVSYSADMIEHDISNIQVHNPSFKNDFDINYYLADATEKASELRSSEGVLGVTTRMITNGMVSSPQKAGGVQIRGIDLKNEAIVTGIDSMLIEGTYFKDVKRNPVIIGSKMAENLKVKIRSKIVLTFTDGNGDVTAGAFRIVGIVKSSSISINELYAFVRQDDLSRLLGINGEAHEIAVLTEKQFDENSIIKNYKNEYPEDKIESWREIAPELEFMQEMYGNMLYILMGIIMFALVFGIVNTMLMAVLERTKELGILMAVGMNKIRVYFMIVIETIFLALIGAPIGLVVGALNISLYREKGVDLSNYSEGLEAFGYSSILYPYLEISVYSIVTAAVFITAILASLYPAYKAIKLKPVEAIHSI
jgi:ABC-type lipoprotein release transport system permease subunit